MIALGLRRGWSATHLGEVMEPALPQLPSSSSSPAPATRSAASLTETGSGGAVADVTAASGRPVLLLAFLISLIMRAAQGSATAAITTAAALLVLRCRASISIRSIWRCSPWPAATACSASFSRGCSGCTSRGADGCVGISGRGWTPRPDRSSQSRRGTPRLRRRIGRRVLLPAHRIAPQRRFPRRRRCGSLVESEGCAATPMAADGGPGEAWRTSTMSSWNLTTATDP